MPEKLPDRSPEPPDAPTVSEDDLALLRAIETRNEEARAMIGTALRRVVSMMPLVRGIADSRKLDLRASIWELRDAMELLPCSDINDALEELEAEFMDDLGPDPDDYPDEDR